MKSIIILIPTYNPTDLFSLTINSLHSNSELRSYTKVVVNDGSTKNIELFSKIFEFENFFLIEHKINQGKGAAIKTGLRFALEKFHEADYLVTVDADNQHKCTDIISLIREIESSKDEVLIGTRGLNIKVTPLRSYFGNYITKLIFQTLYQADISDTQSGLRGYPKKSFESLLMVHENRYDFEMRILIALLNHSFKFRQVPISTIYYDKNSSSHFNVIMDSARIYYVLLSGKKWLVASVFAVIILMYILLF